jgi:hypothetical protein
LTKKFFSPAPKGVSRVLKAKKTILKSRYGMCLSILLFLSELGTCPQNLIPTRSVEHWEKNHFPQEGMLKFTFKGRFLTIKIAYEKFLDWKSERWKHALRSRILFPCQIYSCSLQKHPFSTSWTPKTSSPHHVHVRVGTYVQRLLLVKRQKLWLGGST